MEARVEATFKKAKAASATRIATGARDGRKRPVAIATAMISPNTASGGAGSISTTPMSRKPIATAAS